MNDNSPSTNPSMLICFFKFLKMSVFKILSVDEAAAPAQEELTFSPPAGV